MKLVIEQELAQQCLNAIAKLPYQDVFQLVPKLLQLPILQEDTPAADAIVDTTAAAVASEAQAASTQAAQEIATSN